MKHLVCLTALILSNFIGAANADTEPSFGQVAEQIQVTLGDDFETGSLSAWESYPYAQDPGFNPSILTVSEPAYAGSRYSLCQVFKPSGGDFPKDLNRVGMIKRIKLRLTESSHVNAALFVSADRRPTRVRVILCAADGVAYTFNLESPAANEWLNIDAAVADFSSSGRAAGEGVELQAVAIYAEFGVISPARSYQVNLDDLLITGERHRRFEGIEPQTTYLEHFDRTILHRHFAAGESVTFSIRPQAGTQADRLQSVQCTLLDPQGVVKAQSALDPAESEGWSADAMYTIGMDDQPGQWQAQLEGRAASGLVVLDSLYFIVQPGRLTPADHPRLFFDATQLQALISDPNAERKRLIDAALKDARSRTQGATVANYPEDRAINTESLGGPQYATEWADYGRWRKGLTAGMIAHEAALAYAFSGDPTVGDQAAQFVAHLASFRGWNHPWFDARHVRMYYPMGYAAYQAGMAYDLAYDRLTPPQRTAIRAGLLRNVIEPAYQAEVLDNGIPSNVTNHLGVSMGGALIATIALLGEDPSNPDMEPYFSGFLAKLQAHINAAYLTDGSYAESFCYHHMDSEMVTKAVDALERNVGIDLTNSTQFGKAYLYSIYTATPNGQHCPDMGDALAYWGPDSKNHFLWLAKRNQDPLALNRYRWLTSTQMEKPIATDFFDAIWMPDAFAEQAVETLSPSIIFAKKGNAIFRSDWSAEGLLLNFHAGPHNNHFHFDQGSFLLRYGGEDLISEADYADYYYNLNYHPFYTQAIGHNTLLLNDHPESQMTADMDNGIAALTNYPRIIAQQTEGSFSALEAGLAPVYKGRLRHYRRSIVQLKADYLVLCDRIEANESENYNWIFHAKDGRDTISGEANTIIIKRPQAQLRMQVVEPAQLVRKVADYPDAPRAYLDLGTQEANASGLFLSVLIPSKSDNQTERDRWEVSRVEEQGKIGVRVRRGGEVDTILFGKQISSEHQSGVDVIVRTEAVD